MSKRAWIKQKSQNNESKRNVWRKKLSSDEEATVANAASHERRAREPAEGGIPWQIFHEPQAEEQAELIWDPVGSLSAEIADLQLNRGFSGFSQDRTPVIKNGVYSGPYHWRILQQAATLGGLSAVTHFLQQAISGDGDGERVDVRVIDIDADPAVQPVIFTSKRIDDLHQVCKTPGEISEDARKPFRIFIVNQLCASIMEILGSTFDCSPEFFNDHLQQSGDDVDLILPSRIGNQPHIVIPYMRRYTRRTSRDVAAKGRNLRSSFSHGYLATTEEHITVLATRPREEVAGASPVRIFLILCDSNPRDSTWVQNYSKKLQTPSSKFLGDRLQDVFLRDRLQHIFIRDRFQGDILRDRLQDDILVGRPVVYPPGSYRSLSDIHQAFYSIIMEMALELAKERWVEVLRDQERYIVQGSDIQRLVTADVRLANKEAFDEYLKRVIGLLKADLKIIAELGRIRQIAIDLDDFIKDYSFMQEKVLLQIAQNSSTIPAITAMMAVEESRKAIEQAADVKALTTLATIYIPLSFVASIFGMNVTTFTSDIKVPFWMYFVVAVPITIASMTLVWYWVWILETAARLLENFEELKSSLYYKFYSGAVSEGATMKGLAQAGGVFAAVGRTGADVPNDELMNRQAFEENIA